MADIHNLTTWQLLHSVLLAIISALTKCTSNIWKLKLFPTESEISFPNYAKNTAYTALQWIKLLVVNELIIV